MTTKTNYPITDNEIGLTMQETLLYIETFPDHVMSLKDNLDFRMLLSRHHYPDGLVIEIYWRSLLKDIDLSNVRSHEDLFDLANAKALAPMNYLFVSYSTDPSCTEEIYDRFQMILMLRPRGRKNQDFDYAHAEFTYKDALAYPDFLYTVLLDDIYSFHRFHEYLASRNHGKSPPLFDY